MIPSPVAMVFAHPAHEILVAGLMQRHRPQLLFLTRSDSGGERDREALARAGLERLGLTDQATFLGLSEVESYGRALEGDTAFYLRLRDGILGWLREVRPAAVFGDAFELSNFHHDLTRALLDAALRAYRSSDMSPANHECPLVCRTEPELWKLRLQEFPAGDGTVFELTEDELKKKQELIHWVGLQRVDAAMAVSRFPPLHREVYRSVPWDRDYGRPPAGLQRHYDDWGRMQVQLGKHRRPVLFEEHFVPIARALGLTAGPRQGSRYVPVSYPLNASNSFR